MSNGWEHFCLLVSLLVGDMKARVLKESHISGEKSNTTH